MLSEVFWVAFITTISGMIIKLASMAYSLDDGLTWTLQPNSPFYNKCLTIDWNGSIFMAGGQNTFSQPAINFASTVTGVWTGANTTLFDPNTGTVNSIKWSGSYWLAAGQQNTSAGNGLVQISYDNIKSKNTSKHLCDPST